MIQMFEETGAAKKNLLRRSTIATSERFSPASRMLLRFFLVIAFATLCRPAMASTTLYTDGSDLVEWFDDDEKFFYETLRFTYVRGVADTLNKTYFCIEGGVSVAQLAAIVERYLRENPEKWHEPAPALVARALATRFSLRITIVLNSVSSSASIRRYFSPIRPSEREGVSAR